MKLKSYHKTPCFYPDGSVNFYTSQLVSTTDYYAFGQIINARTHSTSGQKYRYNHNGHEIEDDIADGVVSAEFWMYDGRLGRRWEVDPIDQISISNYACFANNPIATNDPDGLAPKWLNNLGRFLKNPFKYKKHRYNHNFKNTGNKHKNRLGTAFMKMSGFFRQVFTGAKSARMLIPQGKMITGDWQDLASGSLNSGQKSGPFNLYGPGGLDPTKFAGRVAAINLAVWTNSNSSFIGSLRVQGMRNSISGDGGAGWRGMNTWTGLNGFGIPSGAIDTDGDGVTDHIGANGHSNFLPFVSRLWEILMGSTNRLLPDGITKNLSFWQAAATAADALNNRVFTPYRKSTALRVVNDFSVASVNYNLTIKLRQWQQVTRSRLWNKLHHTVK